MIVWPFRDSRRFSAGLFLVMALGLLMPASFADQSLESAKEPIHVKLTTALDAEQSHYGDPFSAVLTESYTFGGKQLPAGTVFNGQVRSARKSMPLAMAGYVALDVTEAVLPCGTSYRFNENGEVIQSARVHHPKAKTPKMLIKSAIPFSMVSASDALPLKLATNMTGFQIMPISLAARMTLGVLLEATKKEKEEHSEKNHPVPTRVGHGVLRGSGLTGAYYMLHPAPEPELAAGTVIPLRFSEREMGNLFRVGKSLAHDATGNTALGSDNDLTPIENEGQGFSQVHGRIPQEASEPASVESK